jgi:hypothetical protein
MADDVFSSSRLSFFFANGVATFLFAFADADVDDLFILIFRDDML